jgi:hypothetical protein
VLRESPLFEKFVNGQFESLERDAAVTPFTIGTQEFESLLLFVDGIYSRFVRGIKTPITLRHQVFRKWQEAARKDVERCFGVLKGQWQFLARPTLTIDLDILSASTIAVFVFTT